MNSVMKMMVLTNARKSDSEREDKQGWNIPAITAGSAYEGGEWPESRFRDRRGREHYDNGRFAPMRGDYDGGVYGRMNREEAESRREDRSRANRKERTDEAARRDGAALAEYQPFPVYGEEVRENHPMNQIGFSAEGNRVNTRYPMDAAYQEGNRRQDRRSGYASGSSRELTEEMAEEWTQGMRNEDGTKGAHWTMEQTKQVMTQRGIETDPVEFWAIMNMLYSDYCAVLKKHGVNKVDLYADLACAWLNDKDARSGKAAAYFEEIVRH